MAAVDVDPVDKAGGKIPGRGIIEGQELVLGQQHDERRDVDLGDARKIDRRLGRQWRAVLLGRDAC